MSKEPRATLEFYADPENWEATGSQGAFESAPTDKDRGSKARIALAILESDGKISAEPVAWRKKGRTGWHFTTNQALAHHPGWQALYAVSCQNDQS